jgi:hypothetical protein
MSTIAPVARTPVAIQPSRASHVFTDVDRAKFRELFGVRAFQLRHCLTNNRLFSIERLANSADLLLKAGLGDHFKVNHGTYKTTGLFAEMGAKQKLLTEFDRLPESDSWMRLSYLEKVDSEYRDVIRVAMQDLEDATGLPFSNEVTLASLSVFMASPNIVTPYHIDHEANFLCQVAGRREVFLYDPYDRECLPDREIEEYYSGNGTAARYRQDMDPRGRRFELAPGVAVHHPSLAAHRLRNGPEVSISVSINFCMRDIDRRARIFQVNHLLRKAGLQPTPPGRSAVLDSFKARSMQMLNKPGATTTPDLLFSGLRRLRAGVQWLRGVSGMARRLAGRVPAGPER